MSFLLAGDNDNNGQKEEWTTDVSPVSIFSAVAIIMEDSIFGTDFDHLVWNSDSYCGA